MNGAASNKSNVIELNKWRNETREKTLERLFTEHGTALRSFLLRRLKDKTEIEDIAQEVFIRLANKKDLEACLDDESSKKSRNFLFTVANNLVVDIERRRVLQREYQIARQNLSMDTVDELGPHKVVEARQDLSTVKAAILNLKPSWRKAFTMSRFGHMSYREISKEMGVSVKQVESYMIDALATLRETMLQASGKIEENEEGR